MNIATPFIDLSESIQFVGPSTIDPGQRYGLVVTVTNNGNAIARGPLQFQLGTSASSDGSSTTVISVPTRHLVLPAGRSENFLFVERVAAGTSPSSFFGDVTVDPNDTFGESDITNNFAVTSGEETVRDPFDNIFGNFDRDLPRSPRAGPGRYGDSEPGCNDGKFEQRRSHRHCDGFAGE